MAGSTKRLLRGTTCCSCSAWAGRAARLAASPTPAGTVSRAGMLRPCPPFDSPHECPPIPSPHASSISQGCTLGWYALPLWGKWDLALSRGGGGGGEGGGSGGKGGRDMGPHASVMVGYRRLRRVVAEGPDDFGRGRGVGVVAPPHRGDSFDNPVAQPRLSRSCWVRGRSVSRLSSAHMSRARSRSSAAWAVSPAVAVAAPMRCDIIKCYRYTLDL